jgi:Rrf2 family protein
VSHEAILLKITSQEEYGLRCLLRLARAVPDHALTITEIAAGEKLSTAHVAKLLAVLRQAGLVDSVRGRTGGYRLSHSPADITLGSVMLALGEPLFDELSYCQRHAGTETDGNCVHHGDCNLRALWQTLEHWMRHALNGITLADFLQNEGRITELLRARLMESDDEAPLLTLGKREHSAVLPPA